MQRSYPSNSSANQEWRWTKRFIAAIAIFEILVIGGVLISEFSPSVIASIQSGFPVLSRSGNTNGYVNFTGALTGTSSPCLDGSGNLTITGCTSSGGGGGLVTFSALSVVLSGGTGAVYVPLGGGGLGSGTEADVQAKIQPIGTFSNMCVVLSAAPGGADSITVTLRKAAVDQAITVTLTGATKVLCDTTHTFTNAAGDLMNWSIVPSGVIALYTPNVQIVVQVGTLTSGSVNSGTAFQIGQYATTGSAISGVSVTDCPDTGGNHLNRIAATGVWSCGTSGSSAITFTPPYIADGGGNFYGPVFAMIKPTATTFAWRNQGTGSIVATNGSVYINTGAGTSGYNWRIRETAAPATPYILTVALRGLPSENGEAYAGLVLVDSGTGKLESFTIGENATRVSIYTWTNVTTFGGTIKQNTALDGVWSLNGMYFMRISDDGANRKFFLSPDGVNYIQFYSEATGTFLTPDNLAFGVNTNGNAAANVGMVVYSWLIN